MDKLLVSCTELCSEITTKIKGNVPEWLNVELIRLGPAKWDLDGFVLNHWLDGCAMLCKFSIKHGCVKYCNKFLDSDAYHKMLKVKRPVYTEFGTRSHPDPCKNVFSRFFSQIVPADLTDNGCVNVYKLSNEYYAASETCNIWKISQKSLNAEKKINLDKIIGVNLACSHVQYMDHEDYAYNMSSSFLTGMKYHLIKIPLFQYQEKEDHLRTNADDEINEKTSLLERASVLATISSSWTTCIAYYHSFGITKNFVIFVELPLLVNGFKLATCTPKGKPLKDCFEWHPNEKARFYAICKRTGRIVRKFQSEPFFYFHIINAYEDDGHIVADFMAYQNAAILDKWDLRQMRQNIYDRHNQATPKRFVLPLHTLDDVKTGENLVRLAGTKATAVMMDHHRHRIITVTGEELSEPGFELPTINYRHYNGKKYRFCYGSGVFEKGPFSNSLCKLNVQDRTVVKWYESPDLYPGECIFVPRPGAADEDDGVLLCIVLSANVTKSHFLLILDAGTFTEIARADVATGYGIIPPTIHGVYEYINET